MILVKNRELLIPNDERYIGTTYDDVSENRVFEIPRFAQNGVDLAGLTFKLDLEYANGAKDTAFLDVSAIDSAVEERPDTPDDDKIKVIVFEHHHKHHWYPHPIPQKKDEWKIFLTWEITSSVMQVPGTVFINIRATDEAGTVKWASFRGALYVEDTINTPGTYTGSLTELEQLEAKVSGVIKSEEGRVAAEEERVANEQTRITAEASRNDAYLAAEADRQSAFEGDQTARQNAFDAAQDERAADFEIAEAVRENVFNGKVNEFDTKKAELIGYATESKSWAVGGTGIREVEDSDNSMYYANQAKYSEEMAQHYMDIASTYAEYHIPFFTVHYDDGNVYYSDETSFEFEIDPVSGNMNYVPKEAN